MQGIDIRTNISICIERARDFYLIILRGMGMKSNIEFLEKIIDFTDFLKSIQLEEYTVFKFLLCLKNGTPECRCP